MLDKLVVTGEFRGLREGNLVRIRSTYPEVSMEAGDIGIVLCKTLVPRSHDSEMFETFDPMVLVVSKGRRAYLSIDDVEIIE